MLSYERSPVSVLPRVGRAVARLPRQARAVPGAAQARCALGYYLFLLANAALFIKPQQIWVEFGDAPIYLVLIIASLVFAFPAVLDELRPKALARQPITVAVIGLLGAVVLSNLIWGRPWEAREYGKEFG